MTTRGESIITLAGYKVKRRALALELIFLIFLDTPKVLALAMIKLLEKVSISSF